MNIQGGRTIDACLRTRLNERPIQDSAATRWTRPRVLVIVIEPVDGYIVASRAETAEGRATAR